MAKQKTAGQELAEIVAPLPRPWTITRIATELGVARSTIYRWISGDWIPDAEQDRWLRENVGLKGRWSK